MKKAFISLLMFTILQIVNGQDQIITIANDTIHCRIISISPTHIQYEQKMGNGNIVGKFIPIKQVLTYVRNQRPVEIDPYYDRVERKTAKPSRRWMIGLQAGGGFLTESSIGTKKELMNLNMTDLQTDGFYKQLKRGWYLHADFHFMDSDFFGVGMKYSLFTSSVHKDFLMNFSQDDFPAYVCVGIEENMYVHYVTPMEFFFRQWLNKDNTLQLTEALSAGFVHYRDEFQMNATFYLDNVLIEGNTWGATCSISLDYYPVSWLSLGINAGAMYSRLTKLDFSTKEKTQSVELSKEYYQFLSRFDCSLGIRFIF